MTSEPATSTDLARMRSWRTFLLAATAVLQGGQYVLFPERALTVPGPYAELVDFGRDGWRVIGLLLVAAGAAVLIRQARPVGFIGLALVETFLGAAQIKHGYIPSTLILPIGLCLAEVSLTGNLKRRARRKG